MREALYSYVMNGSGSGDSILGHTFKHKRWALWTISQQQPLCQVHYFNQPKVRMNLRMSPTGVVLNVAKICQNFSSTDPLIAIWTTHSPMICLLVSSPISHPLHMRLMVSPKLCGNFFSLQCPVRKPIKSRRFFRDICNWPSFVRERRWRSWFTNGLFC